MPEEFKGSPKKRKLTKNSAEKEKSCNKDPVPDRLITLGSTDDGFVVIPPLQNEGASGSPRKKRQRKQRVADNFDSDTFAFVFGDKKKKSGGRAQQDDISTIQSVFTEAANTCCICGGEEKEWGVELSEQVGPEDQRSYRNCLSQLLSVDSRKIPHTKICKDCLPDVNEIIASERVLREKLRNLRKTVSSREAYPLFPSNNTMELCVKETPNEEGGKRKTVSLQSFSFNELAIKPAKKQDIIRAVQKGDAEKVAEVCWKEPAAKAAIVNLIQYKIAEEVGWFARKDSESWFRHVPDPEGYLDFQPEKALEELETRAPLLFQIVASAGVKSKVKFLGRKGGISEAIKMEWKKRYLPTLTCVFANILKLRDPGGCAAFQYHNTKMLHERGVGPKVLDILHKLGVTAAASTWRNLRKPAIYSELEKPKEIIKSQQQSSAERVEEINAMEYDDRPYQELEVYAEIESEEELVHAENGAVAPEMLDSYDPSSLCEVCNLVFANQRMLLTHTRARHGHRISGAFTSKRGTTIPPRIIHKLPLNPIPCFHCKRKFPDASHLKLHQLVDHALKIQRVFYQCYECGRQFEDVKKLWGHIKVHTDGDAQKEPVGEDYEMERIEEEGEDLACRICRKEFSNRRSKEMHEAKQHQLASAKMTASLGETFQQAILVCDVCREQFADQVSLDGHMRMHIGEEELLCYDCDLTFATAEERKVHFESVHDAGKVFTCNLCGSEFGNREEIHHHLLLQHDSDPGPSQSDPPFLPQQSLSKQEGLKKGKGVVEEETALVEVVDFQPPELTVHPAYPQLEQWTHMPSLE